MKKIIIIGGGAAGFFSAINIATKHPDYKVTILEKTSKVLSKVKISGGGRCNVTHHEFNVKPFSKNYPRGEKQIQKLLHQFQAADTVEWFKERGIALTPEEDGRMFPSTNSSQTIIDCFLFEAEKLNIKVIKNQEVIALSHENHWTVSTKTDIFHSDSLVITTGSVKGMWELLRKHGHNIKPPVPSLFTFKIQDNRFTNLPGVSFKNVTIKLVGTKLNTSGPLLITHQGISGPATLRLSAWGAEELASINYESSIAINFVQLKFDEVILELKEIATKSHKKQLKNTTPFDLPKRYWLRLLEHLGLSEEARWCDIGSKSFNKITEELTNATFKTIGKNTFKDEFVTCGGVSLTEIEINTMKSKIMTNVFFAGEVVNIDAITGGFNFQGAWTTSWVVSENI